MAKRQQSRGTCAYCGVEYTRAGMSRHLAICAARAAVIEKAGQGRGQAQTLYHLEVRDAYQGFFWLHLEMRSKSPLEALDEYLRAIWLECCGHLSAFEIGPYRYTQIFESGWQEGDERSLKTQAGKVFAPDMTIRYEYDFGSTTNLRIRVLSQREGKPTTGRSIALMARNSFEPPPCAVCGKPAAWICMDCLYERDEDQAYVCEEHTSQHEDHQRYGGFMGIHNSPRTGVCAYDGPAEPPY
jgi:hypothetical protein